MGGEPTPLTQADLGHSLNAECPGFAGLQMIWVVTSMACALTAIDLKDFAFHEAGPFEVHYCANDVGDLAQTAARVQGGELRTKEAHCRLNPKSVQMSGYLSLTVERVILEQCF